MGQRSYWTVLNGIVCTSQWLLMTRNLEESGRERILVCACKTLIFMLSYFFLSCTFFFLFLHSFSFLLHCFLSFLPIPSLSSYSHKTVIGVTRYSPSSEAPVVFPESLTDLENTTYAGSITAQITIPASALAERQEGGGRYYHVITKRENKIKSTIP